MTDLASNVLVCLSAALVSLQPLSAIACGGYEKVYRTKLYRPDRR